MPAPAASRRRRPRPRWRPTIAAALGLLAALVAACAPAEPAAPTSAVEPEPAPSPALARLSELLRRRGGCYGTCPIDFILVRGDGEVLYVGERFVDRLGVHTGWAPPVALGALVDAVIDGDYAGTKARYRSEWTDQATVITALVLDGQRHVVEDYGEAAPPVVQALNSDLDGLLAQVRWDPAPPLVAGAGGSSACVELRARVAAACFDFAAGEVDEAPCTLYTDIALASRRDEVPAELCLELLRSFERIAPGPGFGPIVHGPACAAVVRDRASLCRDQLLGRPVADEHGACSGLRGQLSLLVPPITAEADPEARADVIRINEYACERWR